MIEQLQLDLLLEPGPLSCEHRHYNETINRVWCSKGAGVWTACGLPFCGELAGCAYEEPDNSPEACQRRLEWLRTHKEGASDVV